MKKSESAKRTIYLSRSERRIGGRLYLRFTAFNGINISFTGDTSVTLLAIYYGARNWELGLIVAMLHISGVVAIFIPRIFRGRKVIRVGFWTWLLRGLCSLPTLLVYFMEGRESLPIIIGCYAMFCLMRTVGMSMVTTIQKHLMVNRTQSDIIYRNATSFQGSMIVSRLVSFCIVSLKYAGELAGLLFQFVLGIIANTLSALTLRKVPSRSVVDYRPGEGIFTILVRSLREPNSRRILYTRWISFGKLILFGMFIPFIRISSGHSAAAIFLLAMAINIASFLSSLSLRPLANMVGNRPVQFYSAVLSSVCFLIISFIATNYSLAVYLILSFLTMFFLNASMLTANRFILVITPDSGAVQFNSMDTFVVSCVALVLGVGGGMLVDISSFMFPEGPVNNYGLVFLLGSLISICQLFLTIRIQEPRSLSLRQSIRMLLNIGNFRIWQTINNLESTVNPVKRKVLIRSIGRSRASLASAEIKKIMMEPVSSEKGELIETLFITKRPELLEYLLNEATDTQAFHREKAVFTLGAYPDERTRQVLVDLLDDPSARIRSSAAKSLGRIGCKDQYEKVSALWLKADSLLELLDYMIALYSMDEKKHYITDVFSRIITNCPEGMQRDILTLLSMQFGMSPTLSAIYREESFQYGIYAGKWRLANEILAGQ